ncbi:MAG: hypothetical protein AAFV86_08745, partial [Pseudomonadota bacterium]
MSNTEQDSFIREVAEEVRKEQLQRLAWRYGPFVAALVVGVVAASTVIAIMDARREAASLANGALMVEAQGAEPERVAGLTADLTGAATVLGRLAEARALAASGQRAEASEAYRALAADGSVPIRYGELATLEAARIDAVMGEGERAMDLVEGLVLGGGPYRVLALELRAALKLNAGDVAGARDDLLLVSVEATPDTRAAARAGALLEVLPAAAGDAAAPSQDTMQEGAATP